MHNQVYDGVPTDLDKQAFTLRKREPAKEVNTSFKLKSHSTIDRLNSLYVDDVKVLDCDVFADSPKRRFTLAQAHKRNTSHQKLTNARVMRELANNPELVEQEKKQLIEKFSNTTFKFDGVITNSKLPAPCSFDESGRGANGRLSQNQRVFNMIKDNLLKRESVRQNQFAVRNYMIPTYHAKTHFKGAQGLQMQTLQSLKSDEKELQMKFQLRKKKAKPADD